MRPQGPQAASLSVINVDSRPAGAATWTTVPRACPKCEKPVGEHETIRAEDGSVGFYCTDGTVIHRRKAPPP